MNAQVGCCGFPKSRSEYFRAFKVVEIQQTFYQPPSLKTAEKWRTEAPADFEFTLKTWQLITHESRSPTYRRLKLSWPADRLDKCGSFRPTEEVHWAWERTREIAQALHSRCIVFQCPATFYPSVENKRNMQLFFRKVKRDNLQFIWEPRGVWAPERFATCAWTWVSSTRLTLSRPMGKQERSGISASTELRVTATAFPAKT